MSPFVWNYSREVTRMIANWPAEIGAFWYILQCTEELDNAHLWNYRLPHVGADEDMLRVAERALGYPLDPHYKEFLRHANGWPDFHQSDDLFGTEELVGGDKMIVARARLAAIEDVVWRQLGVSEAAVLPIAVAKWDNDIFVITPHSSNRPGETIWLAGTLVDRFDNFDEFFLSMKESNKVRLETLKNGWGRKDDILRRVAQSKSRTSIEPGPDLPPNPPANCR